MESVLKADIFFFVTTIAVVLLTIGGIIIIIYILRIVKNMKDVTDRLRDQTVKVTEDLDELRKSGLKGMLAYIVKLGGGLFKRRNKKQHEKKHKE
ncbi:MAG: hypothetical protein RLY57_169 [Candidatus Parcubacteria bacterium]|jgi:hypothetical protein